MLTLLSAAVHRRSNNTQGGRNGQVKRQGEKGNEEAQKREISFLWESSSWDDSMKTTDPPASGGFFFGLLDKKQPGDTSHPAVELLGFI